MTTQKKRKKDLLKDSTGLNYTANTVSLFFMIFFFLLLEPCFSKFIQKNLMFLFKNTEQPEIASQFTIHSLFQLFAILIIFLVALFFSKQIPYKEKVAWKCKDGFNFETGAFYGILGIAFTFLTIWGENSLLTYLHIDLKPQNAILDIVKLKSLWLLIFIGANIVLLTPLLEEYIFRHLLYHCMRWKLLRTEAAVLTNIIFAFFHLNLPVIIDFISKRVYTQEAFFHLLGDSYASQAISVFVLAIFLQIIYEKSHSVLPCFYVHAVFNCINFLILVLGFFPQ